MEEWKLKRDELVEFLKEKTVEFDAKFEDAIKQGLTNNDLFPILQTNPAVPETDADNVYNRNILVIKKTLEYVLHRDVRNAKYELSKLHAKFTIDDCELPESVDYYKAIITDSFQRHLEGFWKICDAAFADFASFVQLAKLDWENNIGESSSAKIIISYNFIAQVIIRKILEITRDISGKMEVVASVADLSANNGSPEYEQSVVALKKLVREWVKEEYNFEEYRLELLDSLANVSFPHNSLMKAELLKYSEIACEDKFSVLRTQLYTLPNESLNAEFAELEQLKTQIAKCQEDLAQISTEIYDFQRNLTN